MIHTVHCRFLLSLLASIFILNINNSFADIPNYGYFSLSRDTEKKGIKFPELIFDGHIYGQYL